MLAINNTGNDYTCYILAPYKKTMRTVSKHMITSCENITGKNLAKFQENEPVKSGYFSSFVTCNFTLHYDTMTDSVEILFNLCSYYNDKQLDIASMVGSINIILLILLYQW